MENRAKLSEHQLQMIELMARSPNVFFIADHLYHGIWGIPFLRTQRATPIVSQIRSTVSRGLKKLEAEGLIQGFVNVAEHVRL